jgi:hypothetical protein
MIRMVFEILMGWSLLSVATAFLCGRYLAVLGNYPPVEGTLEMTAGQRSAIDSREPALPFLGGEGMVWHLQFKSQPGEPAINSSFSNHGFDDDPLQKALEQSHAAQSSNQSWNDPSNRSHPAAPAEQILNTEEVVSRG